jgi:DNA-binding CsgD family transcriptional regulator/PAS domain-containing protein
LLDRADPENSGRREIHAWYIDADCAPLQYPSNEGWPASPRAGGIDAMPQGALSADLIADIYEAAIDDERWPGIANLVATAAGVEGVGVWFVDQGRVVDLSVTDDIRASQGAYLAHYASLDPWQRGLIGRPWEQVHIGYELFPERELLKSEFYNDFARHSGIFRPMGAVMRLKRGTFATVGTNRPAGRKRFEETDKPRLKRVLPHLRRALQLRLAQRERAPPADLRAATLDALAFGVVVCDAAGRIVLANTAAEAMARAGVGLKLGHRDKGLGALKPAQAHTLAALVHDAAHGGAGGVVRLTGRDGFTALLALVTPLPRGFGLGGPTRPAYALVTLRSVRDGASFGAEMLIALFGLSPAQAAIALAIFNGQSPEAVAAERNVAISTLRTHLAEIFVRTGTESQRDLIRLLGMLPPVRSQAL